MKSIFVDCSLGISGDMLASALFDVGVPKSIFLDNLANLKVDKYYNIRFVEGKSGGIKGILCNKSELKNEGLSRSFNDIRKLILCSTLSDYVKEKSIKVFEILAEAESIVHGTETVDVHFHELGSVDSIIDIVNVCAAIDFLKPEKIYFSDPPAGKGLVHTSHGLLPVPVPTVLEIAKQNKIPLVLFEDKFIGELTTPTGIALIAAFLNDVEKVDNMNIKKVGIGLGHKNISRPNFLRVLLLDTIDNNMDNLNESFYETIISQEAWIDDSTPEDIAILVDRLRANGAIDVVCHSVDMKKNRKGICIQAIVSPENVTLLREVWFNYSTTIGLKENKINRWKLPRRIVKHKTKFGLINIKQVVRPNGKISLKIEHKDLVKISYSKGIPIEEIRQKLFMELSDHYEFEDCNL
tara:strand:+ start:838 stop:2064 length:1227 start_codon:yes stop_codon:yes gene_type:complete